MFFTSHPVPVTYIIFLYVTKVTIYPKKLRYVPMLYPLCSNQKAHMGTGGSAFVYMWVGQVSVFLHTPQLLVTFCILMVRFREDGWSLVSFISTSSLYSVSCGTIVTQYMKLLRSNRFITFISFPLVALSLI